MRTRPALALYILVVTLSCSFAGAVAVSLAFEDQCVEFPAWANGSSGPVIRLLPPSVECTYGGENRTVVQRESGTLVALGLAWLAGTVACLYVTARLWRRGRRETMSPGAGAGVRR